jgi:hypothetical protein
MMLTSRSKALLCTIVALCWVAAVPSARAYANGGLRGGFSSNPDQFVVGGQLELSPVAHNLYIVPSGELGLGNSVTTLSFNGDLQYRFVTHSKVRFYAGGGLSLYVANPDGPVGSSTNLGVEALGGLFFNQRSGTPMFVELKLGLTDRVPDWKAVFGINFL